VWVTPARRGKVNPKVAADQDERTPAQPHVAMTWAQRLKRAFNIEVKTCRVCGAAARVIACIEDPVVIRKILKHLQEQSPLDSGLRIANPRAHHKPACSANSAEFSGFTHIAARNGVNRMSAGRRMGLGGKTGN